MNIYIRIGWVIASLISLSIAPWWLFSIIVLTGVIFFPHAYEALVFTAAADGIYATDTWAFGFFPFLFITAIALLLAHYIRSQVR